MVDPAALRGVEIRHLEAFAAVADELNFTRAAERLHLAQQALSARVRQLEDRLGAELFERDTHRVRLTAAGEAFRGPAERALREVASAVGAAAQVKRSEAGRLVVGVSALSSVGFGQELVRTFAAERPDVDVEVLTISWRDPSGGVAGGSVDVALVRPPFLGEDVRLEVLWEEPRVAAVSVSHPLAVQASVKAADLLDEPFVHVEGTDPVWESFWTLAARRTSPKRIGAVITDYDNCFLAVGAGRAISLAPASVARALGPAHPGVRFVPVHDIEPSAVALAWRADRETALVRAFLSLARRLRDAEPALAVP